MQVGGDIETHLDYDNWKKFPSVWPRKKEILEKNKIINEG